MALDEEISMLFENYLDDQLSEVEKAAFEQRLQEDASFSSDFQTYKEISTYLANQFSEERSLLKNQLEQMRTHVSSAHVPLEASSEGQETVTQTKTSTKVIQFKPWQLAIAASFAILFAVLFFQSGGGLQQSDYMFSDNITLTERGEDGLLMKQAEMNFNDENFAAAIANFDEILETYPNNTEIQFYKAIALDAIADYTASDELFSQLARGGSVFRTKANYYWAVSQWKQGNVERAKTLLGEIPKNADEYKQAKKLLKKL